MEISLEFVLFVGIIILLTSLRDVEGDIDE